MPTSYPFLTNDDEIKMRLAKNLHRLTTIAADINKERLEQFIHDGGFNYLGSLDSVLGILAFENNTDVINFVIQNLRVTDIASHLIRVTLYEQMIYGFALRNNTKKVNELLDFSRSELANQFIVGFGIVGGLQFINRLVNRAIPGYLEAGKVDEAQRLLENYRSDIQEYEFWTKSVNKAKRVKPKNKTKWPEIAGLGVLTIGLVTFLALLILCAFVPVVIPAFASFMPFLASMSNLGAIFTVAGIFGGPVIALGGGLEILKKVTADKPVEVAQKEEATDNNSEQTQEQPLIAVPTRTATVNDNSNNVTVAVQSRAAPPIVLTETSTNPSSLMDSFSSSAMLPLFVAFPPASAPGAESPVTQGRGIFPAPSTGSDDDNTTVHDHPFAQGPSAATSS